jgi:hypothetical protein
MIFKKLIPGSLACLILISSVVACSAEKDIEERKNLMMPKKSEMMRNSRYKEAEKRKTYKKAKHKGNKKKKLF